MRRALGILACLCGLLTAWGQSSEQLGSSYFAYPTPPALTPAPEGYEPIMLSHYARHGSRWLTEDRRYEEVLKEFDTHQLTDAGKALRKRLEVVWQDAKGRSGELTRIGETQHHDIAQRMVRNFPTLFQHTDGIMAQSSTSRRCMMSMMSACEGIKELLPTMRIQRSAYERDMEVINQESDELKAFKKGNLWAHTEDSIYEAYCHPQRLMAHLFTHPEQIEDPIQLFDGIYWIVSNMQDVGLESLYDILTYDELKSYWKAINYRMYVTNGPGSLNGGVTARSSVNLLQDILQEANECMAQTTPGANHRLHLRFGHDSALLRLLTLMKVEECKQVSGTDTDADLVAEHWHDYELVPMAANLQIIFYQGKHTGDIIVRLLLNEHDAHLPLEAINGCFYRWKEVQKLWKIQEDKQ